MKIYKMNFRITYLLFACLIIFTVSAQNKNVRKAGASKITTLEIKALVKNVEGKPIKDAQIITGENNVVLYTNSNGEFSAKVPSNAIVMVEAFGYKVMSFNLAEKLVPAVITLEKDALFSSGNYLLELADGSSITQRNLVGAVGSISGKNLMSYPDLVLTNSLQGKVAGLIVRNNTGGLGNNTPSLFVRGLHANSANEAVVVIDGIERPFEDLIPEEIESVQVFKDANSKLLYGPRAANGVLWVTTRRGDRNRSALKVTAEAGISTMTRTPEFLNSAQYAPLYNEARANDGLVPFYSQSKLDGYASSKGVNDLLYPNVDYYKEFLNTNTNYKKAVLELNGGNTNVRYSVVAGFTGSDGYEKAAEKTSLNRFNLRGNLDVDITNYLSLVAGVSGRMEIRAWGAKDGGQTFSALTSHRPNEYPFTISPNDLGIPLDSTSGIPHFGASLRQIDNMYAAMMFGGKTAERYANNQTNLGLNFKLDKITKGLKAGAFITFDNYDYYKETQLHTNAVYAVNTFYNETGMYDTLYTQMSKYTKADRKSRANAETSRSLGLRGNVGYENQFGLHEISANLAYNYAKYETKGAGQDVINANYTAHFNYMYNQKYIIEVNAANMGSNRFAPGNKFFLAPGVGASWIITNEDFLNKSEKINFLKLKASYGLLGYDRSAAYLLHNRAWSNQGNKISFGEQNNGKTPNITAFNRDASPDLKWEQAAEFNIGLEGLFFNNRLNTEINYFNEKRSNIIGFNGVDYVDVLGDYTYSTNMGSVANQGLEALINWSDKVGDFKYAVGGNVIWSKSKLLSWNQVLHGEEYRYSIGKPTDAMFGQQALGLFGKDIALTNHPAQTFGPYQEGDIAYKDMNNDNIIDGRDVSMLGNSFPRTTFGVDINLQYKGWGLLAYGYAEVGLSKWTNNTYYWNRGEDKYSVMVLDRYHPVNNPTGTYPRLTTTTGENNFMNSSFWLINTDFFRLKNVEISYTFNNKSVDAVAKNIKIFARGANLFLITKVKDLDPELLNAGVNNYPVSMNFTGGVTFQF